jgi:hypothetical protein
VAVAAEDHTEEAEVEEDKLFFHKPKNHLKNLSQ